VHFASFDLNAPVFDAFGFPLSVQVVTLSNVYGLDLAQTSARREDDAFVVRAAGLSFAGQQERAAGTVLLRAELEAPGCLRVQLRARAPEPIRCTKLLWRGAGDAARDRGGRAGARRERDGRDPRLPEPPAAPIARAAQRRRAARRPLRRPARA